MKKPLEEVLKEATPGTLIVSRLACIKAGREIVAECYWMPDDPQCDQPIANAAILAHFRNVGPELVEALEKMVQVADYLAENANLGVYDEYIASVRDLLSRAKEVEVP